MHRVCASKTPIGISDVPSWVTSNCKEKVGWPAATPVMQANGFSLIHAWCACTTSRKSPDRIIKKRNPKIGNPFSFLKYVNFHHNIASIPHTKDSPSFPRSTSRSWFCEMISTSNSLQAHPWICIAQSHVTQKLPNRKYASAVLFALWPEVTSQGATKRCSRNLSCAIKISRLMHMDPSDYAMGKVDHKSETRSHLFFQLLCLCRAHDLQPTFLDPDNRWDLSHG